MIDANAPHSAAPKTGPSITPYVPTTQQVRNAADWHRHYMISGEEFDRWLAEYTRQQREEAWTEGAAEAHNNHLSYEEVQMLNPYRPNTPPFNIHKWADDVRKANGRKDKGDLP